MESDALSEIVAFAASEKPLPASGLAIVAGCGAALLGVGVVDAAVVDLSDTSDVVSVVDDVVAFTSAATVTLTDAAFAVAGAAASTNADNAGLLGAVALVCGVACFAEVAIASPAAACTVALAVTAASNVIPLVAAAAVVVPDVVAAGVAAEPSLGCVEAAT